MKPDRGELHRFVESYFRDHLQRARGASRHTVRAYALALRLYFVFLADRSRRSVARLRPEDVRAESVLAFLDDLESSRGNVVATRNLRLAAIHGFADYLVRTDLRRAGQYQRILDIRPKRARSRPVEYLDAEYVRALLAQPDRRTGAGVRDHALLLVMFNTGARVAEVLSLSSKDVQLTPPYQIRLRGKGNKERVCPIWSETASALRGVLAQHADVARPIFRNARGGPLTRDGAAYILARHADAAAESLPAIRRTRVTPHVLRHSCAVALLQSGVDPTVIRDYLGHASVSTTNRYITSNLAMKRRALADFWHRAGLLPSKRSRARWRPSPAMLDFLSSL